jgi:hypothetical protein
LLSYTLLSFCRFTVTFSFDIGIGWLIGLIIKFLPRISLFAAFTWILFNFVLGGKRIYAPFDGRSGTPVFPAV